MADARVLVEDHTAEVNRVFESFDLLATPATAVSAHPLGERPDEIDGQWVERLWGAYPFAVPFNVSGHPAIVVPVGMVDDRLPVAVQFVGPMESEAMLMNLAEQLESAISMPLHEQMVPR